MPRPGVWAHAAKAPRQLAWLAAAALSLVAATATSAAEGEQAATIRAHLAHGRYAAAETAGRHAFEFPAPASGPDTERIRELYVEALIRNGKGAEAATLAAARDLLRTRAAGLPDPGARVIRLRLLGEVLAERGDYRSARINLEQALHLGRSIGPPGSIADALDALVQVLLWLEQPKAALNACERAVAIRERERHDSLVLARSLAIRGIVRQRLARYPEARADLARALSLQEAGEPANQEIVRTLSWYSEELWIEDDAAGALSAAERAVDAATRLLRPAHPDLGYALRTLAMPLHDTGDVDRAQSLRSKAVENAETALGPDHPLLALGLNDLAVSLIARGDYSEARRLQRRALGIYERRLGPRSSYVTTAVYNLGVLDRSIGDYAESARMQRRALRTWERTVGPDHPYVAWALLGLADVLARQQLHPQAIQAFERALTIREKAFGPEHVRVARTLTDLSSSLAAVGDLARADALSQRALIIWQRANQPDGLSSVLDVRGRIALERGQFAAAKVDYEQALTLREPLFGPGHPVVGEGKAGIALALVALGADGQALATALEAEQIGLDHLRLTSGSLPERQALGYAVSRPAGLGLALSILARGADAADASRTFDAVIRGRSVVLDEMATRQRLRARASDAAVRPLWQTFVSASQRLANLVVRGPGGLDGAHYASVLEDARRAKENAEVALAARHGSLRDALEHKDIGLEAVAAHLPPASALVSIVEFQRTAFVEAPLGSVRRQATRSYAAFVLRPGERAPSVVSLGAADTLEGLVRTWRQMAVAGITPAGLPKTGSERALRRAGTTLRQRLWDPIAAHLGGVDRVFVVPDGATNLVALAALPAGDAGYLAEDRLTIHYLSAERDLVEFDEPRRPGDKGLLALGGPDYGSPTAGREAPPRRTAGNVSAATTRGQAQHCADLDSTLFPALPASRREAEEVAALWRQLAGASPAVEAPALVLTQARAEEGAFKRSSPGRRVLHLAVHGFFFDGTCDHAGVSQSSRGITLTTPGKPGRAAVRPSPTPESPLLLSGLALAGANRRLVAGPNDEDGMLTAEEVAALNLDGVEWAVLSACDTGLGEIRAGEGVFGLRRAFRVAGTRTVIMSLWPVEDRAARVWMRALYTARLRDRLSTADAMRQASLTVLADRRAKGLSTHPLYWAGFVAAGDWR